jgi:hypothetical protein
MPIVLKSGSLNPLEPSGPVKACNGITLTFTSNILRYRIGQHLTFVASNHLPAIAATEVLPQQGEGAMYEPNQ